MQHLRTKADAGAITAIDRATRSVTAADGGRSAGCSSLPTRCVRTHTADTTDPLPPLRWITSNHAANDLSFPTTSTT